MAALEDLAELLSGRRAIALTGAGCSTESGIPDYRGPHARPDHRPLLFKDFVAHSEVRKRYWARSFVGYSRIHGAVPNEAHHALARLEAAGLLSGLITQNVDRLHSRAGSRRVVELHGALSEAVCLSCSEIESRASVQARLAIANASWRGRALVALPDGDVELSSEDVARFRAPACVECGGALKPNVVLFGENVPPPRVLTAFALLDDAERLLVVGSSLTVFSGYRFVRRASERGIPIGLVNLGPTRGDPLCQIRVDAKAGEALPALARLLLEKSSPAAETRICSRA